MTTGTIVVQRTLQMLGAYSPVQPENPESMDIGKDGLNGMIARWQDEGIAMGAVPLNVIGDELSEPLGSLNGILANLAIELHPYFPGTQVSGSLQRNANIGLNAIKRGWQKIVIPAPVARSTYPKGAGNRRTFYYPGEAITDA